MKKKCDVRIPDPKYKNDILHPCIRYNPNGFCGHRWWMIGSPWYKRNDEIENPILFYGDEDADGTPPLKWNFYSVIKDTPETGYNSDPNIEFSEKGLQILWREVETPRAKSNGFNSVIISTIMTTYGELLKETILTGEVSDMVLSDLSPVILYTTECAILYTAFHKKSKNLGTRVFYKILRSCGKKYYASQTRNIILRKSVDDFRKSYTIPIHFPKNHLPWHFDLLKYKNRIIILLYCLYENNIYIGELFKDKVYIDNLPITLNLEIKDTYKPTGVIKNNVLWLYYTDKSEKDGNLNELFRVPIPLKEIPLFTR